MLHLIKSNLNELLEKTGAISENGLSYFKGLIGQVNLFASSEALVIENQLSDQTHYCLIPDRETELGYSLYIKRVLPEGVSTDNDLPKLRVFQLPHQQSLKSLEKLLHHEISSKQRAKIDTTSSIAERIDIIADEIDAKSNHITNGILLIGGVVAIANPLLGVGIAAKALLPSLSSKVTNSSLGHLSDVLKRKKQSSARKEASKQADQAIKKINQIPCEIKINPLLELLDQSLYTDDPNHDPLTESLHLWDDLSESRHTIIAAEAVSTIYANRLENNASKFLHPNDITWLKSLQNQ